MDKNVSKYPARFDVTYPKKPLNRLTTFFRIFVAIPIFIIIMLIVGPGYPVGKTVISFGGVIFLPTILMLLFRKKYPRWWFDWNLEFTRLVMRFYGYLLLLRDEYPSTDEQQAVHLNLDYPDAKKLNRGLPLIKWFLAIPHYIVLIILGVVTLICVIIAWFAILFTGKYPRRLFDFVVGYLRWLTRVNAYVFLLITDKYPPFSLKP